MAVEKDTPKTDLVVEALRRGVREEAKRFFELEKKAMLERFDKEKDMIVSGLTLHIMKMVDFQRLQDRIVITVRNESKP